MLRLLIDDRAYAVDWRQPLLLRYDSADMTDVESGREGQHILLRLPATAESDRLFAGAVDAQSAERFNADYHSARIEADGVELFAGTAYFDGVEMCGEQTIYRLEIIGGATQWAKQAGREMFNLIELDYERPLDMVDICNSWKDDSPVKFLPVKRSAEPLQNGQTTLLAPEKILTPEDYHPFISVAALFRSIFESAGYCIESRFCEGDLFCSLYMSGEYATSDPSAKLMQMDFVAGRLESSTAEANYAGRVYATPAAAAHSVGNLVDTVASEVVGSDDEVVETGLYSLGGCFAQDEDGFVAFTPLASANVGFEFRIKFACDYRIESRSELKSFDHIYIGDGVQLPFKLTNRFKDRRGKLRPNFEYRAVIFDYDDDYSYALRYKVNGAWRLWREIDARTVIVASPSDIDMAQEVVLMRAPANGGSYERCPEDWALYEGSVKYEGSLEAELTLRTPAVEVSPYNPKRFDGIYFGGAESGMSLTILPGTTLRPIFTSGVGYGSVLRFEDIAHHNIRQAQLLDAVRHMFDLRFFTDERRKIVYIEPYCDFIRRDERIDWSSRVDYSQPITIEEQSRGVHERRLLGYQSGDDSVREYNTEHETEFGAWGFDVDVRGTIEGEQRLLNPLFRPTISAAECYANAESAQVMQVHDGVVADASIDAEIGPRIVRFVGMVPLAEGERWGYPHSEADYPLAAFHFAGSESHEGFTLAFEDRDGCRGLHSFYDKRFAEEADGRVVTLTVALAPDEYRNLFNCIDGVASLRSTFVLKLGGVAAPYRLDAVEEYSPTKGVARCRFSQIGRAYA